MTGVAGRGEAPTPSPEARSAEVARRIELVEGAIANMGREAVLLSTRRDVSWLTLGASLHVVAGAESAAVPIVVHGGGAAAITPNNEADRISDEELAGLPIEVTTVPWYDPSAIDREAQRLAGTRRYAGLASAEEFEAWLQPVRSTLGTIEAERLAWLGRRVTAAMDAAVAGVTPGSTEDDAAAELVGALAREGIRAPVLLAAADERITRYRHPLPGPTAVRSRLMLIVVGERWGLHVALTRFRELEPVPEQLRGRIDATEVVLDAMVQATVPGASFGDVFARAQAAYADAGFPDEWQLHHQGGSIGYAPREHIAVPDDRTEIRAGMAFAWNPSITGAKVESTVVITADGSPVDVTAAASSGS